MNANHVLTTLTPLLLALAATSQSTAPLHADLPQVPEPVREALMQQRWDEALAQLESLSREKPDHSDYWLYLTGIALDLADREDDALAALGSIKELYPRSDWLHKAEFRRAEVLRAGRQFAAAERIYEEALARLKSEQRQGELAHIYMEFGDELSTPPEGARPNQGGLDYSGAAALYERILELDAPRPQKDRALYRIAWCAEQAEDHSRASAGYERYLSMFDPGRQHPLPTDFSPGTRIWQARLRLARNQMHSHSSAMARRSFEDLYEDLSLALAAEPATPEAQELRSTLGDARYHVAGTYGQDRDSTQMAVASLERFRHEFPEHLQTTVAAFEIAQLNERLGNTDAAAGAYELVSSLAPPETEDIERLAEHSRLSMLALYSKGRLLKGAGRYDEATAVFSSYTRRYPNGPNWGDSQQGIVDSAFLKGTLLRSRAALGEAREAWSHFLDVYPLDPRVSQVQFNLADMLREEAQLRRKQDPKADLAELFEQAVSQWERVADKYPRSEVGSKALYQAALLLETELDQLERAIELYKRCDFGAQSATARSRLELMTRPSLEAVTERTWRSDEDAKVKLRLRNVEEFELKVYRLDLEAYFRKHLTHRRIEDLDLDLIAADERRKEPVEGYRPFKPIEREVALPVSGPGVWAVSVSAGELRATTLVIRSDVELILKSSRREVFLFAEDMREGRPAEGVRALVAVPHTDGSSSLEEIVTGIDGVARVGFDDLESAQEVRVLAVREGHFASNGLTLSGLTLSEGLTPRAFVYTDRSAYRPGDRVRWKAVVREVEAGSFVFTPGKAYQVSVVDSRGRTLSEQQLTLGEFGTLNAELTLPSEALLGSYTVRVEGPNLPPATAEFSVDQYEVQKVELTFEQKRDVFYRGETIRVAALARYYFGEPVVESPLLVTLPDGRTLEAVTDASGRVSFEIETRDFPSEGPLYYHALLRSENVNASGQAYLATRGFRATLATDQEVLLAGDSFAIRLKTETPAAEPCARPMMLEVLRRITGPGGNRSEELEELLIERPLRTNEEDGTATTSVALEDGGHYILRAKGTDRFGNPISAQQLVFVSGDEDAVRLRMLASSQTVDVGEQLSVDLINRAGPGLALVTFEGETVLGYRLVQLQAGENKIVLDVEHGHFPNFRIAAAMMVGNEFFTSAVDFDVRRSLTVSVTPAADVVAPGGEVSVTLRATDQRGQPVSAELSLAVVDASLFESYPDSTPLPSAFFEWGVRRTAGLSTATSCTAGYTGATVQIDSAVLAEAQRMELGAAWADEKNAAIDSLRSLGYFDEEDGGVRSDLDTRQMTPPGLAGGSQGRFGFKLSEGRTIRGREQHLDRSGLDGSRRTFDADTAFWTPAVVTDAEGHAVLQVTLPSKSTRWRLTSRGVTKETLAGGSHAELVTRAPFFVELYAPGTCVEGDQPTVGARIHNTTGKQGSARLSLRVESDSGSFVLPAEVPLGERTVVEHRFPLFAPLSAEDVRMYLEVEADLEGELLAADTIRHMAVEPWGLDFASSLSGHVRGQTTFWLELPKGRRYSDRKLDLFVGPSLDHWLLDEAMGRLSFLDASHSLGGTSQASLAADLEGALAVLEGLGRRGRRGHPEYQALRGRIQGLTAALVAAQHEDGGWGWLARGGQSSPGASARVLIGLSAARRAGLGAPDSTLDAAIRRLGQDFQRAPQNSNELKAVISHALASAGQGDFSAANRLHRVRHELSPAALAHLCLALVEMQRKPMAAEVAQLLEGEWLLAPEQSTGTAQQSFCSTAGNLAESRSQLEMTAVAVIALERTRPSSPMVAQGIEYLLARRPWAAARGRGLALKAVALQERTRTMPAELVEVTLEVADLEPRTLEIHRDAGGEFVSIPLEEVSAGRVRIRLSSDAEGEPQFSAVLTGFSQTMPKTQRGEMPFRFTNQIYEAKPPLHNGRELGTGFGVLRSGYKPWINTVEHLPAGELTHVHLDIYRNDGTPADQSDYLVLEVPLPAGAQLLEQSLRGNPWPHEIRGNVLVLPIGSLQGSRRVQFDLIGADPGEYRALPPVLRSAYEPGKIAIGSKAELKVLARGAPSPDEYRPTPDELFNHGQALYRSGDRGLAHAKLSTLNREYGRYMRDHQLTQVANMMLYLSIERGDPAAIVSFFEVIKEKDPELYVPFEKVVAIGKAYRELGEYERALLIFEATIDETFGKDLKVAGALLERGQRSGSLDTLAKLCMEYPDSPAVLDSWLTLADELLAAAQEAHTDESLRRAGRTRGSLTVQGISTLSRFLAAHPTGSITPDAALNLVSAYLSLEDRETASSLAGNMATIFKEPRYTDAFLYTRAVAEWHLGREAEAITLLRRIAAANYENSRGAMKQSENRDLALYILGQIHHARREPKLAAEYYELVDELFVDAREALEGFRKKSIALEEITTARPGEAIELLIDYKNLSEAELLVYEVDLMTLYLREKNLSNVTSVNLAGISPTLRTVVPLGRGDDLRSEEATAMLNLPEAGAYLVICRGGTLHTSGLVLVSDLELEVTEDPVSGRLRVQAVDAADGHYVKDVDVRVVGSANDSFTSGETDPRGLFVADGVQGTATVIARFEDSHYAFHRGAQVLAQIDHLPVPTAGEIEQLEFRSGKNAYFSNVLEFNRDNQQKRNVRWKERVDRDRKGVQVLKVK